MSEIQNTYPVFESNQVLTSTQLNSLVSYLDQQNRLTRAKLIGMGIVCGLDIDYSSSGKKITISKGTGITSEGYLINLGDCETVKYRPYKLPPGTVYEPFVGTNNQQDIDLWELLTSEADDDENVELLENETFLTDKVVLLFVENFDKDLKSCLGKSCDELGKQRILTLRKLLITKTDLQKIWNRTNTGKLDAVFEDKYELPVVNMPRVLFDPGKTHSSDYKEFSLNYANAVLLVFDVLIKALNQTWEVYQPLLMESYNEENPFENNKIKNQLNKLQNFLNDAGGFDHFLGVQYIYDLFTDLILAYNAFKNTAFDLMSECCPDMDRFPKHLMLGEVVLPVLSLCGKSEFRHHFVQPPVYNLQKTLVKKTISLHNRMVMMLESFDMNRINSSGVKFVPKITPSLEKTTPLGKRSIPWYYNVNLKGSYQNLGNLKDYWNFDVSRKCPDVKDGLVLNYDDQSNDQTAAKEKLLTPLYYDIEDYSFFRIEGYIGKKAEDVLKELENFRHRFNLPFNLVSLKLAVNTGKKDLDYSCGFNDIQEDYFAARNNLRSFINDLYHLYYFILERQNLLTEADEQAKQYLVGIDKLYEVLLNFEKSLPACIEDFNFAAFQDNYKKILQYVLKFFVIEMDFEYAASGLSVFAGIKMAVLKVLPSILLDSHLYNRFFGLYHSLKRREFHLSRKTTLFSEFIKKHPGISHGAGVPKGGTFILVSDREEGTQLIADFYLPYLCCTTDNCVPLCEEEDGFRLVVKPFARPDFAATAINTAVNINVLRNDYNLMGEKFTVKPDEQSTNGGKIVLDGNIVQFTPAKDFAGFDTFKYELVNETNGLSDQGEVTVLVKSNIVVKECYSVAVLQCWGAARVRKALNDRNISVGGGASIFEALLNSLRNTGGFTSDEIVGGVLEDEQTRRDLLNCLGIPNNDNTTYDELANLILSYQKINCGGGVITECFSRSILECWGAENVKNFVAMFDISGTGDDVNKMLDYLAGNGGFSTNEMNWLLEMQQMHPLLKCINPEISDNLTNEQMRNILSEYQKANCGGGVVAECFSRAILECWGAANVKNFVAQFNISGAGDDAEKMLNYLRSKGGFSANEMDWLLEMQQMHPLLKCINPAVPDNLTNEQMRNILTVYQSVNCFASIPGREVVVVEAGTNVISRNDVVAVLGSRGIDVATDETAEVVESRLTESRGGNKFTRSEISLLSKKSITNILNSKGIAFTASETKENLISKLFK